MRYRRVRTKVGLLRLTQPTLLSSCFVSSKQSCTEVYSELSWRWIKLSFRTLIMLDIPLNPEPVNGYLNPNNSIPN
jgi:hypothetical protein